MIVIRDKKLKKHSHTIRMVVIYTLLGLGLTVMVFPYIWMILASFKIPSEIYNRFFPSRFTLENYEMMFSAGQGGSDNLFLRSTLNSLVVSSIATFSVVLIGSITGYALARLRFFGRDFLNNFVLFQMLFPAILFLIPRFLLMLELGWINTYQGMFSPFMVSAWAIYLYTQFYRTIPQELIDAARIDGCSELRIVFSVMLPLSKSVTAIVAIFTFMSTWDEFLWYIIVTKDYDLMPLSALLGLFTRGEYNSYPGIQTAGAVILTVPILILFFFFRKSFSKGITMSGIKG